MPSQTRYAAPAYFTIAKTIAALNNEATMLPLNKAMRIAGTALTTRPRYGTRLNTPATAPTTAGYGKPTIHKPSHVKTPTIKAASI